MTLMSGANVTANEDGSITTSGVPTRNDLDGGEQRWVGTGPLLFRAEHGDERLAFRRDGGGSVRYMFGEASPPNVTYEKLAPYEAPRLHLALLAGSLAVFLLTALAWPVGAAVSRWYPKRHEGGSKKQVRGRAARRARVLAGSVSVVGLIFAAGMVVVISDVTATAYGASPLLISVLMLPILDAILTVGVLVEAALAWTRGYWGVFGRMHYSLVALSALTFVALLGYYNLHVFGL